MLKGTNFVGIFYINMCECMTIICSKNYCISYILICMYENKSIKYVNVGK